MSCSEVKKEMSPGENKTPPPEHFQFSCDSLLQTPPKMIHLRVNKIERIIHVRRAINMGGSKLIQPIVFNPTPRGQ